MIPMGVATMSSKLVAAEGEVRSKSKQESPKSERHLAALAEGAAVNVPEVDSSTYHSFVERVRTLIRQMPDRATENDESPLVKAVLREFEKYRNKADAALQERQASWRSLAGMLLRELLGAWGIDTGAASAAPLIEGVPLLSTSDQIQNFRAQVEKFLHPDGAMDKAKAIISVKVADPLDAVENAPGSCAADAAWEQVKKIADRSGRGFVVLFRLSCLDVIGGRFGLESVHHSLKAVKAFLSQSLRGSDAVYHWSDSSLLAVLESWATEEMITAAMQRIANSNRDISIQIGNRNVMLRIPLTFEVAPIDRFRSADDLQMLSRKY
jgi:GGDEF domain-containing protein